MPEPTKSVNQIFISYRREDSPDATGRIYDRLVQRFGKAAIFKDVDSIPLGINFKQHLDSVVKECAVVLVVIGKYWLEATGESGKRRLDDARDFVRIEIESALRRSIPVIPLLVQSAAMPEDTKLPETLQELAYRNGMTIGRDPHFHTDVDRLIKHLENYFASVSEQEQSHAPAHPTPPPVPPFAEVNPAEAERRPRVEKDAQRQAPARPYAKEKADKQRAVEAASPKRKDVEDEIEKEEAYAATARSPQGIQTTERRGLVLPISITLGISASIILVTVYGDLGIGPVTLAAVLGGLLTFALIFCIARVLIYLLEN